MDKVVNIMEFPDAAKASGYINTWLTKENLDVISLISVPMDRRGDGTGRNMTVIVSVIAVKKKKGDK